MSRQRVALWWRWSLRDLRARWVQVLVIAAVVAIGSGFYAGLSSTSVWRRQSYDASYAAAQVHDVRVALTPGTVTTGGRLLALVDRLEEPEVVVAAAERLDVPTQLEATTPDGRAVLVAARLLGVPVDADVDRLVPLAGRALEPADRGQPLGVLEVHFARHYDLTPTGSVTVAGGRRIEYVGHGLTPGEFLVLTDTGSLLAEATYATLFLSLESVQAVSGMAGAVDELVVRVRDGHDAEAVARELRAALSTHAPDLAATVTTITEDRVHQFLYDDIESDQRFYDIFAAIILGGAAFAAFNLTSRMVEAQRREIGIGMALGVGPAVLARRPLLVGVQVAMIGAVLGVAVGVGIDAAMRSVLRRLLPLPVWQTPFDVATFGRGVAIGALLPIVATLWPVWRAVRVPPVDAIRTGHLAVTRRHVLPGLRFVRLPGSTIARMPLRDVARAPRRSALTALGVATAMATLVAVLGMVDTFLSTIDRGERELTAGAPDRTTVDLTTFAPLGSGPAAAVVAASSIGAAVPGLRVGASLGEGDEAFDLFLTLLPFDNALWVPTAVEGSVRAGATGIVISRKAARDLGVGVGDTVRLRHPKRLDTGGYAMVDRSVTVEAIHPNPYRFVAFLDLGQAAELNLAGLVNHFQIVPRDGATVADVQRELFGVDGIAAVQSVTEVARGIRDYIGEVLDILDIVRVGVLLLAVLIAVNSSSISADERRRQHATMLAFGVPPRVVLRNSVVESLVIGIVGTMVGVAAGWVLLDSIVHLLLPDTLPELEITTTLRAATVTTTVVLGVVAVALAPLFTYRRLVRMDVPDTLRVQE